MQNARSIIRQPLPIALLLSVAVHAAMLHGRGIHIHAEPIMESGKTVVHLTLQSAAPVPPQQIATPPQPQPTPDPIEPTPEPTPQPVPEPMAETPEPAPASIELDAAMEADKGVTSESSATSAFRPTYPRISRRRGEEGTVTLSIQVLADGSVGKVSVLQSSGHRRLDEAALQAAHQTRFNPALLLGRAIDSTTELSYTFRLTDD